jgi:ABC-type dipeptide/oligopeptide/nickel transport system permease component
MLRYVARRLAALAFVMLGMSLMMFLVAHALPGDPARVAAGGVEATAEMVRIAREQLGLDRPLAVQYALYLGRTLQGDFGRSVVTRRRIVDDLLEFFPATLELTTAAVVFACLLGVPLGIVSAVRRGRLSDHVSRLVFLFGISMPVFWLGLVAILVFYVVFGLLPAGGRIDYLLTPPFRLTGLYTVDSLLTGDGERFASALRHLVLPALVLSSVSLAFIARMTRSCLLEVLGEDYVRTARAKGLREALVIYKHALRNAAVPILVTVGLQLGTLMGGAVLTETIFTWPGIGTYAVNAVENQDYPALMGFAVTFSFLYALLNVVVDVLTYWLNPRISV